MKRRVLSLALVVFMLLSLMPVSVMAEGELRSDGTHIDGSVTYELFNGVLTVSGVGECSSEWWQNVFVKDSVTEVVIANGITSIGDSAFYYCTALSSITIPDSVTSIGKAAFSYCSSLTSVTIPNSVASISNFAFSDCSSLTSITIPDSVTRIGVDTFSCCSSLTSITIPSNVTSISYDSFDGCSSLAEINVSPENTSYSSIDGVLYTKNQTQVITCPAGKSGVITIPDSVTNIGRYAFDGCSSLTSVTIPIGVTYIDDSAFAGCSSLTSITIPDGVTSIYDWTFSGCSSLTSITIPDSVTSISDFAFSGCSSLTSITIPSGVTSVGSGVFGFCSSLTEINVSSENPNYSSTDGVFYNKEKTCLIQCPGGKNGSITIPDSVRAISLSAFAGCSSLTSITIPDSVTNIGWCAFHSCTALTDVYYGGTCEQWSTINIDEYGNECLTNATIHLTHANYTDVVTAPTCTEQGYTTHTCTCGDSYVDSYVDATGHSYENGACTVCGEPDPNAATGESYTDDNGITYTLYNGVLTISGEGTCGSSWQSNFDKTTVTEVVIECGITSIGWDVFSGCTVLESITIPEGVTIIGGFAFDGCSSLTSVAFPDSVTDIYSTAFRGCSSLTNVVLPDGLDCISTSMFKNCSSLTSITIPDSVTLIYSSAFAACTALTDVYYSGTQEQWSAIDIYEDGNDCLTNATIHCSDGDITGGGSESYTDDNGVTYTLKNGVLTVTGEGKCGSSWQSHFNKSAVTELIIEDGITSVGYWAFQKCTAMTSVTIPDSVTSIGDEAFEGCSSLTSVTISASVTELSDCAFINCSSLTAIEVSAENSKYSSLDGVLYNKDQTRLYTCPAGKSGSLLIPDGVTYICSEGFKGCTALTSVSIPGSVIKIAEGTFKGCTALADMTIGSGVTSIGRYAFDNTAYYDNEANWEDEVLYIDGYLIKAKSGLTGDYSIKGGTRIIADHAFAYCTLANIIIPEGVTNIGYSAFICGSFESVTIPASVTEIGEFAFDECGSLTDVYYGGTCEQWSAISIGDYNGYLKSFATIHLTHVGYTDTVTAPTCTEQGYTTHTCTCGYSYVDTYVDALGHDYENGACTICGEPDPNAGERFTSYGITYTLYNGVLTISGEGACSNTWQDDCFDETTVTKVVIKDGITGIGRGAFSGCSSLTSITIPDSVTSIGNGAFIDCSSLTSIAIPDSVTSIAWAAFRDCTALESVAIPNGVTIIEGEVFRGCSSLESVAIPDSATTVYYSAFKACTALTDVYYNGTEEQWSAVDIYEGGNDYFCCATIHCTDATLTGCGRNSSYTNGNGITYTRDNGVLTVSGAGECGSEWQWAFNKDSVTEVVIEDGVTGIGNWAFDGCTALTSVTIPDSVTSIYGNAFNSCSSLADISVSTGNENYISVDGVLFTKDKSELVAFPGGKGESYIIPDSVTSIGQYAFTGCSLLTSVTIPDSVTSIGWTAFQDCTALADITIGSNIKEIQCGAFDGTAYYNDKANWEGELLYLDYCLISSDINISGECNNIKDGTRVIADYCFAYCKSLKSITIPDSVTYIGSAVFWDSSALTNITIGSGVTRIGTNILIGTAYQENEENWENGVLYVDGCLIKVSSALSGDYSIKEGTHVIADSAFMYGNMVTSIVIPSGVTRIGEGNFAGCMQLTSITIPVSVTSISDDAFKFCTELTDVYYGGTEAQWNEIVIERTYLENGIAPDKFFVAATKHFHTHDYTDVVTAPTCTEQGYTTHTCACGDVVVDSYVDALGHDTHIVGAKSATCTEAGYTGDEVCKTCGETITKGAEIAALGHSYTVVVTAPTCTDRGYTTHTCACGDVVVDTYVAALGHDTELKNVKSATCTESGYTGDEVCKTCGVTITKGTAIAALGHSYTDVVTAPTCTEKGYTTHACACGDVVVDTYVAALGHDTELKNAKSATCTEAGYTGYEACKTCGLVIKTGTEIAALGHSFTDVVTAPTCTEQGYTTYTCSACGYSYVDNYVDEWGHNTHIVGAKDATCTAQGYTGDEACKVCGLVIKTGTAIAALEHETEIINAKDATCTEAGYTGDEVCMTCGETVKAGVEIAVLGHDYTTVVTAPTCIKKGYTTYTCDCGDSFKGDYVAALGHDYKDGYCTVCGAEDIDFVDVVDTAYYAEPVAWAVDNNITSGYGDNTFKPMDICTRAQIVTFIWRAHDCPEPAGTASGFNDVVEGAYYYKAVLWAAEEGITGGYDDGGFHPDELVTRAQAMTFLWRAEGCPAVPEGTVNTFNDVPEGAYYHDAVLWAVATGVTGGYDSTTFGSMDGCTRAQIVTFLYRNMAE